MISLLMTIRWQDIIDIFIVTFIFYRLLIIIRGTRALKMLIGISILLVSLIVSKWIGLYTVDWLVNIFWSQIVISLIILFQPELRRALVQIGQNPFSTRLTKMEETKTLEEIIKTCISLANKKIGAIMVLERDIELKDLIEMGTTLDAKISKEILTSIFLPYSPIHDGAVIIKENRIIAAGCFLPLTLNPDISKLLGTRHRAALGVTEESDAVVIVISEETGSISIIIGGKMTRELDATSLRRVLTRIFIKDKKKDTSIYNKIREMVFNK